MRPFSVFIASCWLAAAAQAEAKSPEKIAVTATSQEGALLIKVPPRPYPYALSFSKGGNSGFLSRVYMMKIEPHEDEPYVVRTLKPGVYRLDSIFQQASWGGCLGEKTFAVRVNAGEIAYLGALDPSASLGGIQATAAEKGQEETVVGGLHMYHRGVSAPRLASHDEASRAEAEAYVRQAMPRSSAPVKLAEVTEQSFSTSKASQAIGVCG